MPLEQPPPQARSPRPIDVRLPDAPLSLAELHTAIDGIRVAYAGPGNLPEPLWAQTQSHLRREGQNFRRVDVAPEQRLPRISDMSQHTDMLTRGFIESDQLHVQTLLKLAHARSTFDRTQAWQIAQTSDSQQLAVFQQVLQERAMDLGRLSSMNVYIDALYQGFLMTAERYIQFCSTPSGTVLREERLKSDQNFRDFERRLAGMLTEFRLLMPLMVKIERLKIMETYLRDDVVASGLESAAATLPPLTQYNGQNRNTVDIPIGFLVERDDRLPEGPRKALRALVALDPTLGSYTVAQARTTFRRLESTLSPEMLKRLADAGAGNVRQGLQNRVTAVRVEIEGDANQVAGIIPDADAPGAAQAERENRVMLRTTRFNRNATAVETSAYSTAVQKRLFDLFRIGENFDRPNGAISTSPSRLIDNQFMALATVQRDRLIEQISKSSQPSVAALQDLFNLYQSVTDAAMDHLLDNTNSSAAMLGVLTHMGQIGPNTRTMDLANPRDLQSPQGLARTAGALPEPARKEIDAEHRIYADGIRNYSADIQARVKEHATVISSVRTALLNFSEPLLRQVRSWLVPGNRIAWAIPDALRIGEWAGGWIKQNIGGEWVVDRTDLEAALQRWAQGMESLPVIAERFTKNTAQTMTLLTTSATHLQQIHEHVPVQDMALDEGEAYFDLFHGQHVRNPVLRAGRTPEQLQKAYEEAIARPTAGLLVHGEGALTPALANEFAELFREFYRASRDNADLDRRNVPASDPARAAVVSHLFAARSAIIQFRVRNFYLLQFAIEAARAAPDARNDMQKRGEEYRKLLEQRRTSGEMLQKIPDTDAEGIRKALIEYLEVCRNVSQRETDLRATLIGQLAPYQKNAKALANEPENPQLRAQVLGARALAMLLSERTVADIEQVHVPMLHLQTRALVQELNEKVKGLALQLNDLLVIRNLALSIVSGSVVTGGIIAGAVGSYVLLGETFGRAGQYGGLLRTGGTVGFAARVPGGGFLTIHRYSPFSILNGVSRPVQVANTVVRGAAHVAVNNPVVGLAGEIIHDARAGVLLRSGAAGVELGQSIRGPIAELRTLIGLRQAGTINAIQQARLLELQGICRSFLQNASQSTRIAFAAEMLELPVGSLTEAQVRAVHAAHSIRPLGPNGTFTFQQIVRKGVILRHAGFTQQQSNRLIISWVTGAGPAGENAIATGVEGATQATRWGRALRVLGYGAHVTGMAAYGYGVYANSMEAADEHIGVEQMRKNLGETLTKMGFREDPRRRGTFLRDNVTIDVEDAVTNSRRNAAIVRTVADASAFAIEGAILAAGAAGGPVGIAIGLGVAAVVLTVHVTADTLALSRDYASLENAHPMILVMMGTGIVNRSAEDLLEHSFNDIFLAETSNTVKQKLLFCLYVRELQKQGKFQELFGGTQALLFSQRMLSGAPAANPSPVDVYQEIYNAFVTNILPLYKAQHLISGAGFHRGFIHNHGRLHTVGSNVARGVVPGGVMGPVNQIAVWNEIIGDNADRRALVRSVTARNLANTSVWHLEDVAEQAYLNLLAVSRRPNLTAQQSEQVQSMISMLGAQTVQGRRLASDRELLERNPANAGVAQSRSSFFLQRVRTAWDGLGDGETSQSLRKANRQPFRIDVSDIQGMSATHLDLSTAFNFGADRGQFMFAEFDRLHQDLLPGPYQLHADAIPPFVSPLSEPPPLFAEQERALREGRDLISKNRQELTKQYQDLRKAYQEWEQSNPRSSDAQVLLSQRFSHLRQRVFLYADAVAEYTREAAAYQKETSAFVKQGAENRNTVLATSSWRVQLWNADAYSQYAGEFPQGWERPPVVLTRGLAPEGPAAQRDNQMIAQFLLAADDRYGSNFTREDVMSVFVQKMVTGRGTPGETATYMATYVLRNPRNGTRSRLYTQTATWRVSESMPTFSMVLPAQENDISANGTNNNPRNLAIEAFARRLSRLTAPVRVTKVSGYGGVALRFELPQAGLASEGELRRYFGEVLTGLGSPVMESQGESFVVILPIPSTGDYGTILERIEEGFINTQGTAILRRNMGRDQYVRSALRMLAYTVFGAGANRQLDEELGKLSGSQNATTDVAALMQYIVKGLRARPQTGLHLNDRGDLMAGPVIVAEGWQAFLERDPMAATLQLARAYGRDVQSVTRVPVELRQALGHFNRFYAYDQIVIPDFEADQKQMLEKQVKEALTISSWPAGGAIVEREIDVPGELDQLTLHFPAGRYYVETHTVSNLGAAFAPVRRTSQSVVTDSFTWLNEHNDFGTPQNTGAGWVRVWRDDNRQGPPLARFLMGR